MRGEKPGGSGDADEWDCIACERTFESEDALASHLRDVGLVC